jgi:hypothetical protein
LFARLPTMTSNLDATLNFQSDSYRRLRVSVDKIAFICLRMHFEITIHSVYESPDANWTAAP